MSSAWSEIKQIYKKTNKPNDFLFNQWVCRPLAAVLVYFLQDTRITPNQVTFLSLFTALLGNVILLFWHTHPGLIMGTVFLIFAFVLDCTDGQLARIRGTSSTVGGLLDFLMDEIKAVVLVAAVAGHLAYRQAAFGHPQDIVFWLSIGLGGVVVVSSGISITTFIRRPEYLALSAIQLQGSLPEMPKNSKSPLQKVIWGCEWLGHLVINYPSWIWIPALFGKIEYFLIPYLTAHLLYLGRAGLLVLWKLGR